MRRFFPAVLLGLILAGYSLAAQVRGNVPLYSLEDCLSIALSKNLDVREANATAQASAAGLTAAFGQYLPSVNINGTYNRQLTNLRPQLSFVGGIPVLGEPLPNNYSLNAGANWTIFNGFLREANYDNARSNVDAADLNGRAMRQNVGTIVRRRYVAVLQALQIVRTRRNTVELGQGTLQRVRAQFEAGRAPVTAVYSQEADLATQEFELVRSENDLATAKANLLAAMGLDPNVQADFVETSIPSEANADGVRQFRATIGSMDESLARALANRFNILAADAGIRAAQAGVTAARAGYFPTVNATGGYVWNNTEISNFDRQGQVSVGLNFRMPIFDQFITNNRIEQAQLTLAQRQLDRQRAEQELRTQLQTAILGLDAAERQLEISQRALVAADLNYRAASERFAVGAADQLDVLTANTQLVTARINRIRAVYNYFDARFQAEFAAGLAPER
jgi:outer membrane protein